MPNSNSTTIAKQNPRYDSRVSAKDNPFAIHRVTTLPFDFRETKFSDHNQFWQQLRAMNFRGAILGRRGSGKTTLLREIHRHLVSQQLDAKLLVMPREVSSQKAFINSLLEEGRTGAILLLDGIERVPLWARYRLLHQSRSAGGFITTIHRPNGQRTLIRCQTSPNLLRALLANLGLDQPDIANEAISLWPKYGGNLRMVLRDLYDQSSTGKFARNLPDLLS